MEIFSILGVFQPHGIVTVVDYAQIHIFKIPGRILPYDLIQVTEFHEMLPLLGHVQQMSCQLPFQFHPEIFIIHGDHFQ